MEQLQEYKVHNFRNVLITKEAVEEILQQFGIKDSINNLEIWQRAFAHGSYCVNGSKKKRYQRLNENAELPKEGVLPLRKVSNERLEWLGDKIIDSVVTKYLYKRYSNQNEGFLTKLRSKLVRTASLAHLAKEAGLNRYLLISEYLEVGQNGRNNEHNLEDCFEAFIGAMSLDFDDNDINCNKFIINMIETKVDMVKVITTNNNHKDTLMRFYQKEFDGAYPKYHDLPQEENGKGRFHVYVTDPTDKVRIAEGWGSTKKKAQQNAAQLALVYYKRQGFSL